MLIYIPLSMAVGAVFATALSENLASKFAVLAAAAASMLVLFSAGSQTNEPGPVVYVTITVAVVLGSFVARTSRRARHRSH